MYSWIWRQLPGPTAVRVVLAAVLFLLVVALLFLFVFPWLTAHLPIDQVTVSTDPRPAATVVM